MITLTKLSDNRLCARSPIQNNGLHQVRFVTVEAKELAYGPNEWVEEEVFEGCETVQLPEMARNYT